MESLLKAILVLITGFLIMISCAVTASAKTTEITKFELEATRMPFQRNYYFPDQNYWDYKVDLLWDVKVGRVFWENDIEGQTFHDAFKQVAWTYKLGVNLGYGVSAVWEHRSEHKLEAYSPAYPIRDSYGLRWDLLK